MTETRSLQSEALERAGLSELATARRAGDFDRVKQLAAKLETADLLAIGALADSLRRDEVGGDVQIHVGKPSEGLSVVHRDAEGAAGVTFLRKVAEARITGPRGARIAVDWMEVGLELAQVALGFGANELAGGVITSKRGLPIADGETRKIKGQGNVALQDIKLRELETVLAKVGRKVVFA